jgi:multidrug efflux pump subunit AcrB
MTGMGVISLAGVVVNNAIVLLDYTNLLRKRGMNCYDAIITAGCTRFRPVMLTAITAILGLVPMAIGISYNFRELRWEIGSEMSQWWGPMSTAVIFGLAIATMLTLFVVPNIYSLLFDWSFYRKGKKEQEILYGEGIIVASENI